MTKRMKEMQKKDLTLYLLTKVHLITLTCQAYFNFLFSLLLQRGSMIQN